MKMCPPIFMVSEAKKSAVVHSMNNDTGIILALKEPSPFKL